MDTKASRDLRFPYSVRITWDQEPNWNEICAWALEHFGLPGHRFITEPSEDYLQFHFNNNQDQLLFVTAWGHDGL